MNRGLSFGFAFLFFIVGYFGMNNTILFFSFSNLITDTGIMLSLETFFRDLSYPKNYFLYEKNHIFLDFYNIPLANAQKQQEENDDINNNNEKEKYVILVFDRGYKTTFTKAKPILDKYDFKATMFVACDRTQSPKGLSWDEL